MYTYDEYVKPFVNKFKLIEIDDEYVLKIDGLVDQIIAAKKSENHHIADPNKEKKRFKTGFLGEAALEKLFNIEIIDWTVGNSNTYHHPDIPGYSVGIKTVEYGKFPIIFEKNYYPQIICVRSIKKPDSNLIAICGLATADVLNTYQDIELIIDPKLKARKTKTGFYGFEHLLPITKLDDIKKYKK